MRRRQRPSLASVRDLGTRATPPWVGEPIGLLAVRSPHRPDAPKSLKDQTVPAGSWLRPAYLASLSSSPPSPPTVPDPPASTVPAASVGAGGLETARTLGIPAILALHLTAIALLQSTGFAVNFILPVLARKRFGANDWQTLLITATPTILYSLSIFWNDKFSRTRFARYLLIYWVVACLPLAFVALTDGYWGLLVCHLIACVGGAGYPPASGELLKAFYPDRLRGRIYSAVWGSMMAIGAVMGYAVGSLLDGNPEAFRVYMPLGAGLQLVGVLILIWMSHATGHSARRPVLVNDKSFYDRVIEPITHTREVLRSDRIFFKYEAAYMTYGVGWMIAYALLPIIVTDKLSLNYEQIASSTHVAYLLAMVAMIFPAGWLMDRLGAVRSTGLSFAMLTVYPVGLILARNETELTIASIVFGVAHAGASVGWMLGPVALAPSQDKVAQYVAIHATMVGIRGKVFQLVGVALYWATKSFTIPLLIAAAAYAWSAIQMLQLHGEMERRRKRQAL